MSENGKRIPGEGLDAAIREQMRIIRREQPNWYERVSGAMRREVALGKIQTFIRESMELPGLERWSKQQGPLFTGQC
jgi:hypothetical protein